MTKYAFIVSSNTRYLENLNGLLNSLDYVGNKHDVHIVSWDLPKSYLDKLNQLSFETIVHEVSKDPEVTQDPDGKELGEGEVLMRYRYELASQLKDYDAVCVLDADTLMARDVSIWFEIAARAKVIIGCALEQKRWYGEIENQKVDGKHVIEKIWNDKDICCSPMFFSPKDFGDAFHYSWQIIADYSYEKRYKAPDMDGLNMAIIKFGHKDRVIALAEATWSGLHETLMKPFSRVCEMHDELWTINGEEIWLIHGQFNNETWRGWQMGGQYGCIKRELDDSPRCKQIAKQCMETLVGYFNKMNENHKIKIDVSEKYQA